MGSATATLGVLGFLKQISREQSGGIFCYEKHPLGLYHATGSAEGHWAEAGIVIQQAELPVLTGGILCECCANPGCFSLDSGPF